MHLTATTNRKGRTRAITMAVMVLSVLLAAPGIGPVAAQSSGPDIDAAAIDDLRASENRRLFAEDEREARGWDAPGVAVNPDDPNHIVQVAAELLEFECSFTTTFDAGNTWTRRADFEAPAGFPDRPCDPRSHGPTSSDQSVSFGSGDNVYSSFAATAESEVEIGQSAIVAKSTDGGATFQTGVVAMPGLPADAGSYRFPKVVAHPGAGIDGQDRVYVVADNGDLDQVTASVSNDGGATWAPPVSASPAGVEAGEATQPVIGPDGAVYVGFISGDFLATIFVAKSTDGVTWTSSVVETDVNGYRSPTRDFGGSIFPSLAVDNSDTETSGNLYVTWQQGPLPAPAPPPAAGARDHFIHPDADVWVSTSTDANATWSAPVQVNEDAPVDNFHQIRHPNISVASNGRVDVVWHDRRHWYLGCQHTHAACDEGRLGDTYYANSTDGGATFSADRRITDRSINNDVGFDYRFGHYWSFGPKAVALDDGHIFVTWMESRNGNFDNDAADIYYSRVNVNATGDAPLRRVPVANTSELSVDMSRMQHPGGSEGVLTSTFATEAVTRVVIVPEGDTAAALAGGVLARANLGSLLVSPAAGLSEEVQAEVDRMDPIGAFVIGDEAALSAQVVTDLTDAGVPATEPDGTTSAIVRIQGSPAEIAAEIALGMDRRNDLQQEGDEPGFNAVIIANPDDPSATSASALAAAERLPVLYVSADEVPAATSNALTELDVDTTLIVGNEAAVSAGVEGDLPGATRLGGADIGAVSQAVVQESIDQGLPTNMVYVARDAEDAAVMGAAVGQLGGLLMVAPDVAAARATVAGLGLQVDRLIAPGPLSTRGELTHACPIGEVPEGGFTDVTDNVHDLSIDCVAWYGIALGGPGGIADTLYGPDLDVRRDQMASFIARMIDHANPDALPAAPAGNAFPCDVEAGNVHFDNIQRLAAAGVVLGGPNGLPTDCYGPEQDVKRDQMASFINRAIGTITGSPLVPHGDLFTDDTASVHHDNINAVAGEGIVVGRSEAIYEPSANVRRDQMASFIARSVDYLTQHDEAFRPVIPL